MKKFLKCVLTIVIFSIFLGIVDADEIRVPTLRNGYSSFINYENGIYTYDLAIDNENYITEGGTQENPKYSIVGYEVYEKNGENYTKVSEADVDGAASLEISSGKSVSLVARAYILNESEERVFSGYSNELVLNHLKPKAPILSNGYESYTSFEDGVYTYDLAITLEDYIYGEDEEEPKYSIDGYEVYEKNGENYTKVTETEIGGAASVNFNQGSDKTFVARAYTENDKGERVYSDYSNELVLKDSLLTIEQVVNKVNEDLDELNQFAETEEDKLIASVDSENNKIVFTSSGGTSSFDFTDEYITYSDLDTVIAEDNVLDNLGNVIMMAFVQNSIIELSGYENKTVSEFAESEEDFPKYGIMYIGEDYDFSKDDENGNHITNTGTYIRKFKITLNKDIISKTVEEYGEDIEGSVPSGLAPTIIVGEVTENSVELSGKVEGSSEDDDYTCFFYRSKNEEAGFSLISDWAFNCTAGEISFDDDGLEPNTNYYYKAIINGGDTYSDVIVVKTKASNKKITKAPTVKTKNGNNNTIELSWNKIDGANTYEVLRSEKKNGKYKTIKKGLKETKYINTGVTYGKTYYYKVKAVGGKNSKTSSIVTGVAKPNKVNNLRFTGASTNNVKLSWDKVNVTGYEIYRSTNKKSWSKISTATKNSLVSLNNKKLKANTTYYYKVRAYKTVSGKKVYGPYSNVVTTKTAPSKPKVTVSVRDYKSLNVKITSVKGAAKYEIYRSTSKTGSYEYMDDVTTSLTYKDENLETGKTYYYKVKACNSKGHCSGYTDIKSKKVTPKTPSMNLQSPETKVITITLGEVNGADGYVVERATSKNGKYTVVKELTSEDELIFDDATKKGTTYYYKARSYTLVNGKEVYSDYTSIKSRKSN